MKVIALGSGKVNALHYTGDLGDILFRLRWGRFAEIFEVKISFDMDNVA